MSETLSGGAWVGIASAVFLCIVFPPLLFVLAAIAVVIYIGKARGA